MPITYIYWSLYNFMFHDVYLHTLIYKQNQHAYFTFKYKKWDMFYTSLKLEWVSALYFNFIDFEKNAFDNGHRHSLWKILTMASQKTFVKYNNYIKNIFTEDQCGVRHKIHHSSCFHAWSLAYRNSLYLKQEFIKYERLLYMKEILVCADTEGSSYEGIIVILIHINMH